MRNNEIIEFEDALFRLAMSRVAEIDGERFEQEMKELNKLPDSAASAAETKRFLKLIDKKLKKQKAMSNKAHNHRIVKRTIIVIAAVMAIFSTLMITVSAFRAQVYNLIYEITGEYTSFQFQDPASGSAGNELIVDWENSYVPTYIPDGYMADGIYLTDSLKSITFKNMQDENRDVFYTEYANTSNLQLDTQSADTVKPVQINGYQGTLVTKDEVVTLAWVVENRMFTLIGQVGENLLIMMAESVKYTK